MPDFSTLNEQEKKRRDLQERKRKLAAQQNPAREDDGSDLEIADDPKATTRDVAQSRRGKAARGEFPTAGAMKQLAAAGASARRESAPIAALSDAEARRELKAAAAPGFLANSQRASKPRVTQTGLNQYLLDKVKKQDEIIIKQKEEEWQRRGGSILAQPGQAPAQSLPNLDQILEQRKAALEKRSADVDMVHDDDGSDEEWKPDGEDAMAVDEEAERTDEEERSPSRHDGDDQADDEGDEENPFLLKRPAVRPPRPRPVAVESDDEEDTENRPPPPQPTRGRMLVRDTSFARNTPEMEADHPSLTHRASISSIGDNTDGTRTEDGTDKENDVRLSFDRGEDKENTAVAVQSPMSSSSLRFGRSFGSLFASEIQASPSGSTGRGAPDGVRSPLQELPAEDDDPFAFTPGPPLQLAGARRDDSSLEASPTLDLGGSTLNLGEGSGLQPAFSLSVKGKGKERARSTSPSPLGEALDLGGGFGGGGGFSQFFTQEGVSAL